MRYFVPIEVNKEIVICCIIVTFIDFGVYDLVEDFISYSVKYLCSFIHMSYTRELNK